MMSSRKVCSSTMLQDCSWSEGMSLTSLTLSHHLGLARALTSLTALSQITYLFVFPTQDRRGGVEVGLGELVELYPLL